jgi:spermidine synthase
LGRLTFSYLVQQEEHMAQGENSLSNNAAWLRRLSMVIADIGRLPHVAAAATPASIWRLRIELFLTSFTLLFFELVCIRWVPAHVRYLSYFMNFLLLASFVGMGVGILASRRERLWLPPFPILLFTLVISVVLNRFELRINSLQVLYYGAGDAIASPEHYLVLPLIFTLVALAFIPLARPLGRMLTALPPLQAYGIDILGSMTGVAVFFAMSYLALPPVIWFALLSLALAPLVRPRHLLLTMPFLLATIFVVYQLDRESYWSPYYRLQVSQMDGGAYSINVNNTGHQVAMSYQQRETFYFRAYDLLGQQPFKRVLILGAGSGSDVSVALHNGAEHVDAVEIDPQIYQLGTMLHPDRPYADPRVSIHIDDGRAFLRHSQERYDLIIFALPDSLTLTSGFSSLRLESFLLTADALKSAREHLTDDGLVVMYNYYRQDWLVHKLADMAQAAFDEPPFVTTYGALGRAAVIMAGPRLTQLDPALNKTYAELPGITLPGRGMQLPVIGQGRMAADQSLALTTDDWPFVYMPQPTVPTIYIASLGLVALISLIFLAGATPRGALRRFDWHFFFLGVAFMLLETRSLVTFALLFGTTWMVNSLVFFAILATVLLAILFNARFRVVRVWPLYILLFVSLVLNYALPLQSLLAINTPALRYSLASLLTFAPIFLANTIFSRSFRDAETADIAFASNLLGVMFGGMLEYMALATGYQALLLPVMLFYGVAFVLWRRIQRGVVRAS